MASGNSPAQVCNCAKHPLLSEWFTVKRTFQQLCRLLTRLSISHCPRLRDDHLTALRDAPLRLNLFSLEYCTGMTPEALSHLNPTYPLESLSFIGHSGQQYKFEVPVSPLPRLSSFSLLTSLRLSDQAIGDPAMATVAELTRLHSLNVAGCSITQDGADRLTTLSALRSLDMSWTLARHPPALQELRSLELRHCTLGGAWEITFALHESQARACGSGSLFAKLEHLSIEGATLEVADCFEVGAALVAFLASAATSSLTTLHAGGIRITAATHTTLMHAIAHPYAALSTLSLWGVQQPPAAGQLFAAVPAPGPHHSIHALTRLPRLRHLRLSSGGSGIERTAAVLLSQEAVAELAALPALERLEFDAGMDVPLIGVCQLLSALTALTHLSTHGPRRPDLQTDTTVRPEDIPSAPRLRILRAALQRPLPPGLLRRLLVAGAPRLQHVDLTCSGSGGGGFDTRELSIICSLPALTRLRFRCGARLEAADALADHGSLREVEISGWSCVPWPQAVLQGVAVGLARRGGSLTVAGELVGVRKGMEEGVDGGTDGAGAVPRLRYPRWAMLALRSTPGSQRALRDCGLGAVVPPGLAVREQRW